MLGPITGDLIGSAYEFRNHRAKTFSPLFHPREKFTDCVFRPIVTTRSGNVTDRFGIVTAGVWRV